MGTFFGRPHPWIMQAIGGLIAVIIIIPIAIYVGINVLTGPQPKAAVKYVMPATAVPNQPASNGGVGPGTSSGSGSTHIVHMQPGANGTYVFSPAHITIHTGDTIKWLDANSTPHNIVGTGNAASLISRPAINTLSYSVTFKTAGTYHYECQVHLPSMVGVVTVVAASASGGSSSAGSHVVHMQPGANGTYVFSPATLTIHKGDTVQWIDADSTPHNIVGLGNAASIINRPAINTQSYSVTFKTAGTYHYECQVHLPSMVGVIKVT